MVGALVQRRRIDAMFDMREEGVVAFYPWGRDRPGVQLESAESVVVRHVLYVLDLLPLATSIPLLVVILLAGDAIFRPVVERFGALVAIVVGVLLGLIIGMGSLVRFAYLKMVASSHPPLED